jgi:hypothetical protein
MPIIARRTGFMSGLLLIVEGGDATLSADQRRMDAS